MQSKPSSNLSTPLKAKIEVMDDSNVLPESLSHLKATYTPKDSTLYKAGCISYNNTISDVARVDCFFCGGPGHGSEKCPSLLELTTRWKADPLRSLCFARLLNDFKISRRAPLNK